MNYQAIAIQEFREGEGLFIRSFFADSDFNLNGWGVTRKSIQRDLSSGLKESYYGKTAPIIMTEDYSHPSANVPDMIAAQEPYRVGNFLRTGTDPQTGRGYVDAIITDKIAIEKIQNGELNFVSPSIRATSEIRMGDGRVLVPSFVVNHLALVKNPAFGVIKAQIKGRCTGTEDECLKQLLTVQASIKKGDHECIGKFSCGTMVMQADFDTLSKPVQQKIENGEALNQNDLTEMMGEDSTEQININKDKEILNHHWYDLPEAYQADPCVSKWIPELKKAHPEWVQDQVIAVAFSKCGESKKGNKEGEGYFWQKNFGAESELKYEPMRGFLSGQMFFDTYASVKDMKVPWGSDDHKILHAMNLPHTHCYTAKKGDKLVAKSRFSSNYHLNSDTVLFPINDKILTPEEKLKRYSANKSGYTEDETYKYIKHNIAIFHAFAEYLKPFQSKKETMSAEEHETKHDKDMEELKKEYEGTKQKLADLEKTNEEEKKKREDMEASLQAMVKTPLVNSIVQAKVKLGMKEEEKSASIQALNKLDVPTLQTMQAEYDSMAKAATKIAATSHEPEIRFKQAEVFQASTEETGKKSVELRNSILARCHN